MYLMKKNKWDLKKTIAFVKSKRSIISPNYGFLKHLENFEKHLNRDVLKSMETKMKENVVNSK